MKLKFSRQIISTVIGVAVLTAGTVYVVASDGMTAAQNTPVSITGPDGVCKKVTNTSPTGLSAYVPTASTAEWQSFVTNPPSGVSLASCVTPGSQTYSTPWHVLVYGPCTQYAYSSGMGWWRRWRGSWGE